MMEPDPHSLLRSIRIDFSPTTQPSSWGRFGFAVVVAIALSLGVDAALVHGGVAIFPSTRGFSHFQLWDYATFTCIGVLVASAGWPLVIRISSKPRWLFLRAAIVVTVLAWGPDVWLVAKGETSRGVLVLAMMHLGVALVTYNALVRIAPERALIEGAVHAGRAKPGRQSPRVSLRAGWLTMLAAVVLVFVLGIIAVFFVPISRPSGWVPSKGKLVFVVHGILGALVLLGAVALVVRAHHTDRIARIASYGGVAGVVIGGAGGLFAVAHGLRLVGMGLMFVGSGIALCAYLMPLVEPADKCAPEVSRVPEQLSEGGEERLVT